MSEVNRDVDAGEGEAEAALEELIFVRWGLPDDVGEPLSGLIATVRHALRAAQAQASNHEGRFELREEDGRRFWFGSEEGWKDGDEIGEAGVLTIDAKHFQVGTVLTLSEPWPEAAAAMAKEETP